MTKIFRDMINHDSAGGVLLVLCALLAMVVANTPLNPGYQGLLDTPVAIQFGQFEIAKPLLLWINDGLMAIFFLLVGLEVKRELLIGHLSSPKQIALPAIAAIAGIIVPALIFLAFNHDQATTIQGWAIPAATDIAFALGIFSLFGRHLPATLKLFLLSVAIFDDIGAIVIIALFYSGELAFQSMLVAAAGLAVLFVLNRCRVRVTAIYLAVGLVVWAAVLKSGVHATLAGFAIAWFIPLDVRDEDGHPLLAQLEHRLQPWVAFFIVPVFAFANAGVQLVGIPLSALFNPLSLGIAAGLFIGKQLGIFAACWLAVKSGIAALPEHATWRQVYGVCVLCGIGFTMSLFVGSLAFENATATYMNSVKVGVLMGSIASAVFGSWLIKTSCTEPVSRGARMVAQ
ncbi:MAG: Na+/H+ antiporter NhaA [Oleiphilaceae bacterium]|nr:Na+/H+ antiporter NhaA [Oleiphilaceae bacterium]